MADQLRITQTRSVIGRTRDQRATVRSLGLKRIRHTVVQPDRPEIRGMLRKVPHLVEFEVVPADAAEASPSTTSTDSEASPAEAAAKKSAKKTAAKKTAKKSAKKSAKKATKKTAKKATSASDADTAADAGSQEDTA
jgi:large subunit ribosomal protein L30